MMCNRAWRILVWRPSRLESLIPQLGVHQAQAVPSFISVATGGGSTDRPASSHWRRRRSKAARVCDCILRAL